MRAILTGLLLGAWLVVGCSSYEPGAPSPAPPGGQTQAKASPAKPAPAPAPASSTAPAQSGMTLNMTGAAAAAGVAPMDLWNGPSGVAPAGQRSTPPPSQPAPKPGTTTTKADVGVGKRGRGYDTSPIVAPITVPVATFFAARERLSFQIQIPQAMQLYKAEKGAAPKTHEEFMENIIKANRIPLPDLPAGHRYIYDPAREELMVERPG